MDAIGSCGVAPNVTFSPLCLMSKSYCNFFIRLFVRFGIFAACMTRICSVSSTAASVKVLRFVATSNQHLDTCDIQHLDTFDIQHLDACVRRNNCIRFVCDSITYFIE